MSVNQKDDESIALLSPGAEECPEKHGALGKKTITLAGSLTLNINNLSGPGMLVIPVLFQQAGWLLPTIFLVVFCLLASLSATMLAEAMALLPGNRKFDRRYEFSTIVETYYGRNWYIVCQCFYSLSLQTMNIASILVCTQVMDQFFVFAFHKSYAFDVSKFKFISTDNLAIPFDGAGLVVTLGYFVCLVPCLPMGFLNLDENVYFQYLSIAILMAILGEFLVQFCTLPLNFTCLTAVGDPSCQLPLIGKNLSAIVGTIMFSYTFVVTVPSWVNEKKENVSLNQGVWISSIACTIGYFLMGLLGAAAFPNVDNDLLSSLAARPDASLFTKVSVYVFSFGVIGLGIPLFSVMVRYNLYVGKVFGKMGSAFWGAVFPWIVSFLLYQGNGFASFVTWASLLVNSFINFGVPMILYRTARYRFQERLNNVEKSSEHDAICDCACYARDEKALADDTFDYTGLAALPQWLRSYERSRMFALVLLVLSVAFTVAAIILQIYTLAT